MEQEMFECLGCGKVWKKSEIDMKPTYAACPECGVFCTPLIPDTPPTSKKK